MEAVLRKVQEKIQYNFRRGAGGTKFFSTAWRGEGAELHDELNSNDKERQKNAVKRVIAGMTLGRDVSHLFMDVVKLGQTTNLELKKLVYLYVLNTAKLQPGKALMAVNTFLQDTTSTSPIVRALAIRTMMCLRVDSVVEYILEPLRRAVSDDDPYVRKNAAIGIGKLFHSNAQLYEEQGFSAELLKLLQDTSGIVSSNAAAVVMEINDYGTSHITLERPHVMRLLDNLVSATEWGQVSILELVADMRIDATSFAEEIVARVTLQLNHTNPSVVMGAIKVIANHVGICSRETINTITGRINAALVSLSKNDPETQYVVCKNIHALLIIFPSLLMNNVDCFYIRYSDPPFVKMEKLRLLLKLVTTKTAPRILKELEDYSSELDITFAEEVVKSVATLAQKIDSVAEGCVKLLMDIVSKRPELLPQVVTGCKNIVRKHPKLLVLESLIVDHGAGDVIDEEARVSLIWMLGEFCDYIQNGRQIILKYVEELMSFEQPIQLAILSAVIKMFIRDPVEMEQLLNTVLETLTTQSDDPDLRDRAYAYWRLLSKGVGVENMKKIVHGHQAEITTVSSFSDAMTIADLRKSINTAAAVFGMPFHSFLPPYGFVNEDVSDDEDEDDGNVSENNAQCVTEQAATGPQKRVNQGSSATTAAKHTDPLDDLLGGQVATSTAPQGSAPKGQSSLFDTDSLFGTQKTDQPPTSLPPLVLQDGNTGISVHCQVVDGPAISIALVNRRPTSVDEPILQINRNLMGFAPGANFTQLVPSIPAGETRHVKFPLKVSEQHFDDKSTALEVAIKGRDVPPLIFKVDVPPEKMLTRTAPLDEPNFMAQWQTLDQSRETRQLLMDVGASMIASPSRRQTLERLGFLFVTSERERDKRLSCYAKVTTALGMHGLVEIALDKTFPEQSYVCLRSHHTSFVMPVVMRIIRSAFQTQQGSVPPAAGARVINASTLDDLFA